MLPPRDRCLAAGGRGERRRGLQLAAHLSLLLLLVAPGAGRARDVPALTGPVVDEAGLLSAGERSRLDGLCRAAWEQPEHRVQLQYLLVGSLQGEDVDGFAVRVFEAWKLGEKGKDNGVLVVVSKEDRKIKIETGYGTEGALTDLQASRIIRNTMAPAFREGQYGEGLFGAGVQILGALGATPREAGARRARPAFSFLGLPWGTILVAIFFILATLGRAATGFGPRRRRYWDSPWGGGWGVERWRWLERRRRQLRWRRRLRELVRPRPSGRRSVHAGAPLR